MQKVCTYRTNIVTQQIKSPTVAPTPPMSTVQVAPLQVQAAPLRPNSLLMYLEKAAENAPGVCTTVPMQETQKEAPSSWLLFGLPWPLQPFRDQRDGSLSFYFYFCIFFSLSICLSLSLCNCEIFKKKKLDIDYTKINLLNYIFHEYF